jgi:TolB-like protein/tetratricopeptide (TPR) repeat protein
LQKFLRELKRRRVYQTIGLYIVGAWVVLQVADLAFESWGLSETSLQAIWVAALILLPFALVFGWRYDVTTAGIVRTADSETESHNQIGNSDYVFFGTTGVAFLVAVVAIWSNTAPVSDDTGVLPRISSERSIAILPFRSLSNNENTRIFSDGMHDDLLTTLANIDDLRVISRTSVLQYRGTTKNLREIGLELGAASILEGGVQHVGDQLRINVQLINAETDEHIWAQKYDRSMTIENLFAIQSEIVETIANSLTVTLSASERTRIRRDRTDNIEAFAAFSRGKKNYFRRTFESQRTAVADLAEAVELDPDYFLARVMLARTYSSLVATGAEPLQYMLENGRQHIDHAVRLEPNSGYGLAVLAEYESAVGVDGVEEMFDRALTLSPNSVEVLDVYATYLRQQGKNQEALEFIDRALGFDPLSTALWHDRGRATVSLGRFEEANTAFERIAQIDPKNPYASHGAAMATVLGGQLAAAAYWGEINARTDVDDFENTSSLAIIYISLVDMSAARAAIDTSLSLGPAEPYPLAVEALFLTIHEQSDAAVIIARSAMANGLANRWGSERIFLRTIRDEALATGQYEEAIGWYRRQQPAFFEDAPLISAANVQRAADLGALLLASGDKEKAQVLLAAVIEKYEEEYVIGAANYPMGIAGAEALALLGRNEDAISELQRVVDDGWRLLWQWDTLHNRNFDGLRDDPRFDEIIAFLQNDLAEQVRQFKAPM